MSRAETGTLLLLKTPQPRRAPQAITDTECHVQIREWSDDSVRYEPQGVTCLCQCAFVKEKQKKNGTLAAQGKNRPNKSIATESTSENSGA